MAYAVLTDETRKQLEQERSRLLHVRAQIEAKITEQVTAEVDRTIQQLTALLDLPPLDAKTIATEEVSKEAAPARAKSAPVSKVEPPLKQGLGCHLGWGQRKLSLSTLSFLRHNRSSHAHKNALCPPLKRVAKLFRLPHV
jgi:hypothetical protein